MTTCYPVWTVWPPGLLVLTSSLSISMLEKGRHGQWPDFTFLLYQSKWRGKRNWWWNVGRWMQCQWHHCHFAKALFHSSLCSSPFHPAIKSKASWRRSKGQLSDHWARKSVGMAQHQAQSSSLRVSKWSNIYQSSLLSLLPPPSSFLPKDKNYHLEGHFIAAELLSDCISAEAEVSTLLGVRQSPADQLLSKSPVL